MYCPSCANPVKDGLKYCNSCGAKLGAEQVVDNSTAEMLDGLLDTIFWTAVLGLGILVGLISVMLYRQVPPELVAVVSVFYLATVGLITFMLARQVPKLIDAKIKSAQSASEHAQLASPSAPQLDEYREPAMSITERTTKTLNKKTRR